MGAGLGIIFFLIYFIIIGISIYSVILFIKLARRGIKALDIFIDEKSKNQSANDTIKLTYYNHKEDSRNRVPLVLNFEINVFLA
ncbi:hypothetical protein [Clostridium saccharoperbutylacetonicum]|uniref:hypothetical protein n=1 Tax=Clostridium saccharoperbutylacetonicum TaxID=36745 RepID=UPI0039ED30FD